MSRDITRIHSRRLNRCRGRNFKERRKKGEAPMQGERARRRGTRAGKKSGSKRKQPCRKKENKKHPRSVGCHRFESEKRRVPEEKNPKTSPAHSNRKARNLFHVKRERKRGERKKGAPKRVKAEPATRGGPTFRGAVDTLCGSKFAAKDQTQKERTEGRNRRRRQESSLTSKKPLREKIRRTQLRGEAVYIREN